MTYFKNIAMILKDYWKVFLITGVGNTLLLSVIAVGFGVILGILIAIARMQDKIKPLKWLAIAVSDVIRGTPMLLQLYVGYFLVPKIIPALNTSAFACVAIALAINSGCYMSEVVRSGIQSVDKGQTEAARSLGLTSSQCMKSIILPQAVKHVLPAVGNEFVTIIKDTSLASTFFVGELMTSYLKVNGNNFLSMENLMIVGIIYFILTFTLTKILNRFEKHLQVSEA